jgi:hypothetical protein
MLQQEGDAVKLDKLSRTDLQITAASVLLVIGLIAFPWFHRSIALIGSISLTGTDAPDGFFGVLALLFAVATVADLMIERFSPQTGIPALGGSREMTRFILACAAAACVALKFITNIHFSFFGWGFYVDVVITAALVYSALEARRGPLT